MGGASNTGKGRGGLAGTPAGSSDLFAIVPARYSSGVSQKTKELGSMGIPYIVVCGERTSEANVTFRERKGKWDAINYGALFRSDSSEIIILNDVDTVVHHLDDALDLIRSGRADLVYCDVRVQRGPQVMFYRLLNPLRRKFNIAASGELMCMKKSVFDAVLPLPPSVAEDSYIIFRALERGYRVAFCAEAYVSTIRTLNARQEEAYKSRSTLGIYQALSMTKPPLSIRFFYMVLPFLAPLLIIAGRNGLAWMKGIEYGVASSFTGRKETSSWNADRP